MAHTNAIYHLALAMISSAHHCAGDAYGTDTICFIFRGEELPLIKEDTNGIHIQVRCGEWETYTPSYKEVYKKCWECWLIQKLKVVRNRIIAHQWRREDVAKIWKAEEIHAMFPALTKLSNGVLTYHDGTYVFYRDTCQALHYYDDAGWDYTEAPLTERQVRDYMIESFSHIKEIENVTYERKIWTADEIHEMFPSTEVENGVLTYKEFILYRNKRGELWSELYYYDTEKECWKNTNKYLTELEVRNYMNDTLNHINARGW